MGERREIDEEFEDHIARRTDALIARGMDPAAARAEARRRFGNVAAVRAECVAIAERGGRRRERARMAQDLGQDVRQAFRAFRRRPGASFAVLVTLALGIGALTSVFAVAESVLLRPLPIPDAGSVVVVRTDASAVLSPRIFDAWQRNAGDAIRLAAYNQGELTLTGEGLPRRLRAASVTAGYFDVLGMRPRIGRVPDAGSDVLLADRAWRVDFGARPDIVGQSIVLNGVAHTVTGVLPGGADLSPESPDVWVPLELSPADLQSAAGWLRLVGRMAPGVTIKGLEERLQGIAERVEGDVDERVTATPIADTLLGDVRAPIVALAGGVGLLLLLACANIANLLLASGVARRREFAVRAALGAGRGRIVRQLMAEHVLLALLAGTAGLVVAAGGIRILVALAPAGTPRIDQAGLSWVTILFAAGASLGTAVLFGVAPTLASTGRAIGSLSGRVAGLDRPTRRLQGTLVGLETALAVVLVIAGGLLVRTAVSLARVPVGFDQATVTARIAMPSARYPTVPSAVATADAIRAELASLPGIEGVAYGTAAPLVGGSFGLGVTLDGGTGTAPAYPRMHIVTPGWFDVVGMRFRAGSAYTAADDRAGGRALVVTEGVARALAVPPEDLVGRTIRFDGDDFREADGTFAAWRVTGVLADARTAGPRRDAEPALFFPPSAVPAAPWDWLGREVVLTLRADAWTPALAAAARAAAARIDPAMPLHDVRTLEQRLAGELATERMLTIVLVALAALGLLLAGIGIAGVVAHGVARRTREIGVRMALGASITRVQSLVVRQALVPVLFGIAAGVAGALVSTRLLASVLYGVGPADPVTFVGATLAIALAATAAAWWPARRAAAVDPVRALAAE